MNELQWEMIGELGIKFLGFCVGAYIMYRLIKKNKKKSKKKLDSKD